MKKTIAEQLNVIEFPFRIKDSNGNKIYSENSDGYWIKYQYDANGNIIYYEDSDGYWCKKEYDANGNRIYFEDSDGEWCKKEYDSKGNRIYYKDSYGEIIDNRPKEVTLSMDEIAEKFGIDVKDLKVKK